MLAAAPTLLLTAASFCKHATGTHEWDLAKLHASQPTLVASINVRAARRRAAAATPSARLRSGRV